MYSPRWVGVVPKPQQLVYDALILPHRCGGGPFIATNKRQLRVVPTYVGVDLEQIFQEPFVFPTYVGVVLRHFKDFLLTCNPHVSGSIPALLGRDVEPRVYSPRLVGVSLMRSLQ